MVTSAGTSRDSTQLVVNDSGRWTLLGTQFYEAESVHQTSDGHWFVEIRSTNAEDDAHLSSRQPQSHGRSQAIPFVHRNDGFLVTLRSVEFVSHGGEQVWRIRLAPESIEYGGSSTDCTWHFEGKTYTHDELAHIRARRILLNDPPPLVGSAPHISSDQVRHVIHESYIRGINSPVSVEHCIVKVIYQSFGSDPGRFLQLAWLASIFYLKAGNVVEKVLELSLSVVTRTSAISMKP